jgi:hypothetical protein
VGKIVSLQSQISQSRIRYDTWLLEIAAEHSDAGTPHQLATKGLEVSDFARNNVQRAVTMDDGIDSTR